MNPVLSIILSSLIMGTSGIFIKFAALPSPVMSFIRTALPALVLGIYFLARRQRITAPDRRILLASFFNAVRLGFFFLAFAYTTLSKAVLMLYTWPLWTALFGFITKKEKADRKNLLLLLSTFCGIGLIYFDSSLSFSSRDFIGLSAMAFSAFLNALTVVLFKECTVKYNRLETTFYQNLVPGILFLPAVFILDFDPSFLSIGLASSYALIIGVLGFSLFFYGLKRIPASTASHLAYIEALSAVLWGVLIFKDPFTWNLAAGGFLILVSIGALQAGIRTGQKTVSEE